MLLPPKARRSQQRQDIRILVLSCGLLVTIASASGQSPPSGQSLEEEMGCGSSSAEPATQPQKNPAAGTAPGNTGSTGWTGGTGGNYLGTNPQGALPESRTWQPPTARGLDLMSKQPGC